jgi:hypothetical protein
MDISPLPHKAPFSFANESSLPSPTPDHTPASEEEMLSPCEMPAPQQFPTGQLEMPRPVSATEYVSLTTRPTALLMSPGGSDLSWPGRRSAVLRTTRLTQCPSSQRRITARPSSSALVSSNYRLRAPRPRRWTSASPPLLKIVNSIQAPWDFPPNLGLSTSIPTCPAPTDPPSVRAILGRRPGPLLGRVASLGDR